MCACGYPHRARRCRSALVALPIQATTSRKPHTRTPRRGVLLVECPHGKTRQREGGCLRNATTRGSRSGARCSAPSTSTRRSPARTLQPRVPGAGHRVLLGRHLGPWRPGAEDAQPAQPLHALRAEPPVRVQAPLPRRAAERLHPRGAEGGAAAGHRLLRRPGGCRSVPARARGAATRRASSPARRRDGLSRLRLRRPRQHGRADGGESRRSDAELVVFDAAGTASSGAGGAPAATRSPTSPRAPRRSSSACPTARPCSMCSPRSAAAPHRAVTTVIDLSTIGIECARQAFARGERDGPRVRRRAGVRRPYRRRRGDDLGDVCGPAACSTRTAPALDAMAKHVFHVGARPVKGKR